MYTSLPQGGEQYYYYSIPAGPQWYRGQSLGVDPAGVSIF